MTIHENRILLYNYLLTVKQFRGFDVAFLWDLAEDMLNNPSNKSWRLVDRKAEKLILYNANEPMP